jgi:AAA15 family ATPase/GTPase
MKIQSFRIYKFRNIEDSGEIELLDNLNCFVGKNQSGKTALLHALFKFNPHEPNSYNMRHEWPRGQRTSRNLSQTVCEVRFLLEKEERQQLAELTDKEMLTDEVVITKDYDGNFEIYFSDQPDLFPNSLHPNDIDNICESLPVLPDAVGDQFAESVKKCLSEARRFAREGRFDELSMLRSQQLEELRANLTQNQQPLQQNENQFLQTYTQKLQEIERHLGEELTMHERAHNYLVERIPTFIYMDDYRRFRGRANLNELLQKCENKNITLSEEDETILMILALSGLDLETLVKQGKSNDPDILHERQLDLQDASVTLTKNVAGRWGQNNYKIQFRVDGQTFFTDIEEVDKNIGMIPLEEQSKGFQWFFSFDLHFMHDSEGTFEGCVLLLDEPGLHLHPGGQEDLLKRLDAYAEKNELIYTTHLPFLVDLREPARIKVLNQTDEGVIVSDNLGASQEEERLTLQAALGMRANQSYLVSEKNLVVEGVDDYWIITELSNLLERSKKQGLSLDVMVTAAGSASDIVHTATFMIGQELQVLALFDSDGAGRREEEKLRKKWITRYKDAHSFTLLLGEVLEIEGDFMIEDLFPANYYLQKVRESHENKLKAAGKNKKDLSISGDGPILPRVEQACNKLDILFNKGSVAKLIRKELVQMDNAEDLPDDTVEKADKLFDAIREIFPA